jgi:hypothetical protein
MLPSGPAVYVFENVEDGKLYIGSRSRHSVASHIISICYVSVDTAIRICSVLTTSMAATSFRSLFWKHYPTICRANCWKPNNAGSAC